MRDKKPKIGMPVKYRETPKRGFGGSNVGDYGTAAAPRVGGKAQKSTGMAKGTASKKLLKTSAKNVRKSAASRAAKRSARKLY